MTRAHLGAAEADGRRAPGLAQRDPADISDRLHEPAEPLRFQPPSQAGPDGFVVVSPCGNKGPREYGPRTRIDGAEASISSQ